MHQPHNVGVAVTVFDERENNGRRQLKGWLEHKNDPARNQQTQVLCRPKLWSQHGVGEMLEDFVRKFGRQALRGAATLILQRLRVSPGRQLTEAEATAALHSTWVLVTQCCFADMGLLRARLCEDGSLRLNYLAVT